MAAEVQQKVEEIQRNNLNREYGGKASNEFVEQLKASTLFQFDWSELLCAAPAALSTFGDCWIAASVPIADQVSMKISMPTNGFNHLTKRANPSLRSCLVDGKLSCQYTDECSVD